MLSILTADFVKIDAACVGESGVIVTIPSTLKPLAIAAVGRGSRQMCCMNRYGFPRTAAKSVKRVQGFQTGDIVKLQQPTGKYAGCYTGKVAVWKRGAFDITTTIGGVKTKITSKDKR
ncbi:hypothetical protein D5085_10340 [Ectothiorhodospiraceae bacterium BW-2]|nr:hypothetical protein D5085_10340 [Ectothiorhodospiraceae bacterium BW-2]